MNRITRWTTRFLAGFWILDGLLQLQPAMWTRQFVNSVRRPAAAGQPEFFHRVLVLGIILWCRMPVAADLSAALLQMAIGVLLLLPRAEWRRRGLYFSLAWGLAVWVMGECLGGLLTSGASIVIGLPGSALIYVGLSWVLLTDRRRTREQQMRWGLAGFWFIGAVFQARAYFWKPDALGRQLSMVATTSGPGYLTHPIAVVARWVTHSPMMTNALLVAVFFGIAILTLVSRPERVEWMGMSLAVLFVLWWIGMDFGVLGGVGTDPNTAPLMALAVVARYGYARASRTARQPVALLSKGPEESSVPHLHENRQAR